MAELLKSYWIVNLSLASKNNNNNNNNKVTNQQSKQCKQQQQQQKSKNEQPEMLFLCTGNKWPQLSNIYSLIWISWDPTEDHCS